MEEFYVMDVNMNVREIGDDSVVGFYNHYELTPVNGDGFILYESDILQNIFNYCKTNKLKVVQNTLFELSEGNQNGN